MKLLTIYYKDDLPARQEEIDRCLQNNLNNTNIDEVIIFTEELFNISNPKLKQIVGKRLTYQCAFEYANKHLVDDICILANSDIYFDDSINLIKNANMINKFYAITRYNIQLNGKLKLTDSCDSQDVWIFKSPIRMFKSNFELGRRGCDNRIAWEARNAGLIVLNPCKIIKCHHLHLVKKRNYLKRPIISGPRGRVNFGSIL